MKLISFLFSLLAFSISVSAQNGKIVEQKNMDNKVDTLRLALIVKDSDKSPTKKYKLR